MMSRGHYDRRSGYSLTFNFVEVCPVKATSAPPYKKIMTALRFIRLGLVYCDSIASGRRVTTHIRLTNVRRVGM